MTYAEEFEDRWFWETDAAGHLTYLSKSVAEKIEIFGLTTMHAPITEIFHFDQSEFEQSRSLGFHIFSRTPFSGISVRGKKGLSESWWSMSGRPFYGEDGQYEGFVGSGTDLTQVRKQEAMIKRLALSDSLTGLANRQNMQDHLSTIFKSSSAATPECALLMLDLDGFKGVNDTLGHPVGDALLIQVGRRIHAEVGERGIVGRLGGDEFQILLPRIIDKDILADLAASIIDKISLAYEIERSSITVSCSIGIAITQENDTAEVLVRNADIALYAAKNGGRGTYRFFENEMLVKAKARKELEDELRLALNQGQLSLVYQPVVATNSENLTGFEALLRWQHPSKGEISPSEFIPVAEETGLIQQIGAWVIRSAANALTSLPDDLRIAVNVSPLQFANPSFVSIVASAVADNGVDPSRLELEITESVFLDDFERSQKIFNGLKHLGVRLALDDFGTGYSGLGYLQHAPFDKIKIDQSFVRGAIDPRNKNSAIIAAIVALSTALNMETTAEGVEHQDEIEMIKGLGCSHIQGYVFGAGVSLDSFLPDLNSGLRRMRPIGHKRSRSPRINLIRSAKLEVNDGDKTVRLRNLSATGVSIDEVYFNPEMIGVAVLIEILEGEMRHAHVRWVGEKGAGLEFAEPISLQSFFSK